MARLAGAPAPLPSARTRNADSARRGAAVWRHQYPRVLWHQVSCLQQWDHLGRPRLLSVPPARAPLWEWPPPLVACLHPTLPIKLLKSHGRGLQTWGRLAVFRACLRQQGR